MGLVCGQKTWRPLTPLMNLATRRSHASAGQIGRLLHPSCELSFVELVVLMDVEVSVSWLLDAAGGTRAGDQPRALMRLATFMAVAQQPGLLPSADAQATVQTGP